MDEKQAAEARMNAAVGRWLIRRGHAQEADDITGIDVDVAQDGWCETCGTSYAVEVSYRVNGGRSQTISISPYNLGAWIGELM